MRIVDAFWTKVINYLVILCDCGKQFNHRSDRWNVRCGFCGKVGNLQTLRDRYLNEKEGQSWQSNQNGDAGTAK